MWGRLMEMVFMISSAVSERPLVATAMSSTTYSSPGASPVNVYDVWPPWTGTAPLCSDVNKEGEGG